MRNFFNELHQSALVSCVELVLMNESNTKYHLVVAKLRSYDVTIMDSYNRMDYLKIILKEVYQGNYLRIINDIKMCLGDLVEEKDISEFFKFMEI